LKDLLAQLGYGSIWVTAIIIISKFVIKPLYDSILSNKVEIAKIERQSKMNREEMLIRNKIEVEGRIQSSQLEYESYKRDRVLSKLEAINEILIEHNMQYASYGQAIVNKYPLKSDIEKNRLELDGRMIENKDKILIYLPRELRLILNRLRVILSVSWKEPMVLNNILREFDFPVNIVNSCLDIYKNHLECFYELVEEYLRITNEKKDYSVILKRYGFNEEANYIPKDFNQKVAECYILLHEYKDSEDYTKLDNEFNEIKKLKLHDTNIV